MLFIVFLPASILHRREVRTMSRGTHRGSSRIMRQQGARILAAQTRLLTGRGEACAASPWIRLSRVRAYVEEESSGLLARLRLSVV